MNKTIRCSECGFRREPFKTGPKLRKDREQFIRKHFVVASNTPEVLAGIMKKSGLYVKTTNLNDITRTIKRVVRKIEFEAHLS